jgi:hypothetical protein
MVVGGRAAAVAGLLLVAVIAGAGVVPPGTPTAAAGQAVPAAPVPTTTVPVLGDFDGDGSADLLWYGPGSLDDHLWLGRASRNFAGVPLTVRGHYLPLAGDFDGGERADILWYGPGSGDDVVWFGHGDGRFSARQVTAPDGAEPFTGDFDGNGRHDVFWYPAGGGRRPALVRRPWRPLRGSGGHRQRQLPAADGRLRRRRA